MGNTIVQVEEKKIDIISEVDAKKAKVPQANLWGKKVPLHVAKSIFNFFDEKKNGVLFWKVTVWRITRKSYLIWLMLTAVATSPGRNSGNGYREPITLFMMVRKKLIRNLLF